MVMVDLKYLIILKYWIWLFWRIYIFRPRYVKHAMGEEKERKQAFSSKYNSLINVLTPLLQDKCLILLENVKTDTDFWIVKNINILQLIFVEKQESKNELI